MTIFLKFSVATDTPLKVLTPLVDESSALFDAFIAFLPSLLLGAVFLLCAVLISAPIGRFATSQTQRFSGSQLLASVVGQAVKLLVIALGLYILLKLIGLSGFALTILSSAGVAGIIIGFAFKDIAENFIASILISIQKPFKLDDVIEVDGVIGVVSKVTSRATTLVDFDGDHIQIPNATVYKSKIRNLTANPKGRVSFQLGIGYDSSIRKAQEIAYQVLIDNDSVLNEPEPLVLTDNLGSSTINMQIYFWIDVTRFSPIKVKSMAIRQVLRALEQANISMPDDARERVFPQGLTIHTVDAAHKESFEDTGPMKQEQDKRIEDKLRHDSNDSKNIEDDLSSREDVSSDTQDIQAQAKQSRAPEEGNNIL
uniref:mechanosensitive ion channel family protein n=1 Tax=Ningiella ruwaisensis TaxID=2364274 RepID=UPI0010A0A9E1|nr:mechanosensitive ion channel family protein [Ningiella ruwaisensis]